jgi:WD40 repeat protein
MIGTPNIAHDGVVWCVAYGPNEIVSGSDDNKIKYWDHQLKLLDVKHSDEPIFSLKFNENYSLLASGVSNLIYIWQSKQ